MHMRITYYPVILVACGLVYSGSACPRVHMLVSFLLGRSTFLGILHTMAPTKGNARRAEREVAIPTPKAKRAKGAGSKRLGSSVTLQTQNHH